MRTILQLTIGCLVIGSTLFAVNNVYVDINAVGANNGASWQNAYTDLQSALPGTSGDVIHVAQGRYSPGSLTTDTFSINSGVSLMGGYSSYTSDPNIALRQPLTRHTILDGDVNGDDVIYDIFTDPCGLYTAMTSGERTDNNARIITIDTKTDVLIDGFVIEGASNTARGGGLWADDSTFTVKNCTFKENIATRGSGLYTYNCTFSVDRCCFTHNTCYDGGGSLSGYNSSFDMTNCQFVQNVAVDFSRGSAVYLPDSVDADFRNCCFSQNYNSDGYGGTLAVLPSGSSDTLSMTNCRFVNNINEGAGTITLRNDSLALTANFVNCLIAQNQGHNEKGAAMFLYSSSGTSATIQLTNCSVVDNTCHQRVPGIYMINDSDDPLQLVLKNSILWGNDSDYDLDEQISLGDGYGPRPVVSADYCCIDDIDDIHFDYDDANNLLTTNIWSLDPCFADADYHLSAASPCIDAGHPADAVGAEPKCNGDRINMGAYGGTIYATPKVDGTDTASADINCDQNVDLIDFAAFADRWLE